jgi:5-methylcytosine-specific restriction protein B
MYCLATVPQTDEDLAVTVVRSFFDLYAYERGWQPLKTFELEFNTLVNGLLADLAPKVTPADVAALLRRRRFVVLQGPPGTGKTRLAEEVRRDHFEGRGMTVQFHPAVTYEDFVVGLFPDPSQGSLRFDVRPGWLLKAAEQAAREPFLLVIDEINRADLGKILGEAIYLFEAGEVGGPNPRKVQLTHPFNGKSDLMFPENLYVLGTLNTADRSIAGMDLAVRRRFAFVPVAPQWEVVAAQGLQLATDYYERLYHVFIEHVPDDTLDLMPGHAYFLASDEAELRQRLRYELLPLLDEYLRHGFMGPAASDLQSVRDGLENEVGYGS